MELTFITPAQPIEHPLLFTELETGAAAKAVLQITGLGLYRASINGRRVGRDYLTPGFNDYDAYLRFQTYDVTDLLTGRDRVEVLLGNGWYKGAIALKRRACTWGDRFLLAARLTVTHPDGTVSVFDTDETWQAVASPIVSSGIYEGETRDDTRAPGTSVACVRADVSYRLEEPISPAVRVVEERKPRLIVTPKGEQVLDFGQNAAGIFRFINRAPRGARVDIQTGEVLQQGCFYRDNLRKAESAFHYISDGVVKDVEPTFTFFGFRYIKVEGLEKVDPADFTMLVLSCDLRPTLKAELDHPGLTQLMHNAFWGQRSNFVDVPTDCPQRDERLGWTADTQVFVNTACYQMDCKDFYRKFMKDMRADQVLWFHGNIPAYSPSMKHEASDGGAVWADAGTIIPWNVYMNYGDKALLAESYPMMRDYVEVLIANDIKDGGTHTVFPYFTFGDWVAQDGITPQSVFGGTEDAFIQGCYYMYSVQLTGKAAAELGYAEDAARYGALAEEIRAALIDEYVTPGGRLAVDTQTAYVLALRYGILRGREKLLEGFRRRLRRDRYRLTSGFTGAPLLLPVLFENGMTDQAYRMLLTEEFPGWLYAVKLGATTVWERWNSLNEDGSISGTGMNSLNHYAYGSVCEAIYAHIMGLKCAAPGWKRAEIAPKLNGQLRHSDIRYASAAGDWHVAWDILEDGSVSLRVTVPEEAAATVTLPDHPEGLTEEAGPGDHSWSWMPARDYLHPYSGDTMLMDLADVPEAMAILDREAPEMARAIRERDVEAMLDSPRLRSRNYKHEPERMEAFYRVDAALRQIRR